jgi:hypothetical protein
MVGWPGQHARMTHSEGHRPATLLAAAPLLSHLPAFPCCSPSCSCRLAAQKGRKIWNVQRKFLFFFGGINKSEWTDIKVRAACTTSSSRVAMPLLHFIYRKKWMKKKNGSEAELLSFACCEAREKIHASMRTSLSFARDLLAQSINVIGSILFVLRF